MVCVPVVSFSDDGRHVAVFSTKDEFLYARPSEPRWHAITVLNATTGRVEWSLADFPADWTNCVPSWSGICLKAKVFVFKSPHDKEHQAMSVRLWTADFGD